MSQLDSDLLRTFLAIEDAGSVSGGADRIGRSQSATSLQVRQLEGIVGQPLFHRHGRGVVLTLAGEKLKPVARKVVQSLDATLSELRGGGLHGRLRIGMADDHTRTELAGIISGFSVFHPDVELDVHCALGSGFGAALGAGTLDLAIHEVPKPAVGDIVLREDHLIWMQAADRDFAAEARLPVAVFDRDCWWRDIALSSLQDACRPYAITFTSESVSGVRAAVEAGVAIGLLSASEIGEGLRPLATIRSRHPTHLVLQRAAGAQGPICDAMVTAIRQAFSA